MLKRDAIRNIFKLSTTIQTEPTIADKASGIARPATYLIKKCNIQGVAAVAAENKVNRAINFCFWSQKNKAEMNIDVVSDKKKPKEAM